MVRKAGELKAKARDALVRALIEKYETEPNVVEKALPEVAQLLKELVYPPRNKGDWEIFKMDRREEEERRQSYQQRVKRLRNGKSPLSKEEAIAALEDAAALVEGSLKASLELSPEDMTKLVKIATGLSLSKKGKVRQWVLKEGAPARSVSLLRGVQLHLTWDKKLLSATVSPKQLELRQKALAFVGIAQDEAKDTARSHDLYLAGEYSRA